MTDITDTEMTDQTEEAAQAIIGVRFREAARLYHYSAPHGALFPGDYVVVETARGEEMARVVTVPEHDDPPARAPRGVRPILRQADREDREAAAAAGERAERILEQMRQITVRDRLDLYPVAVQLNLRGDAGAGYFQAEEHIDFRPLAQEIEREHAVQLDMQHAGPRDRAKLVDGYDICGLRLCCASWMTNFPKVGIRTAKDQGLGLNPDSISGVCGRLLCCLTFEHEVYREMRGTLPKMGKRVSTPAGMGKVIKQNILQQYVTIALDDHPDRVDVPVAEIGLAVRTEESPNQALADSERRQDHPPRERREQRPRRIHREHPTQEREREQQTEDRPHQERTEDRPRANRERQDHREQPTQEREREQRTEDRPRDDRPRQERSPEPTAEPQAPQRRRRRRRAVNQDTAPRPTVQPSPRAEQPTRRRRRRRNPNPEQPE